MGNKVMNKNRLQNTFYWILGISLCSFAHAGEFFAEFCPNEKADLKIECYRNWLKSENLDRAHQLQELKAKAFQLAQSDSDRGANQGQVLPWLIDSLLLELEHYSFPQDIKTKEEDRQERTAYTIARVDLLKRIEEGYHLLSDFSELNPEEKFHYV
jgi:hypothetical protein